MKVTTAQRAEIMRLLRKGEFDTRTVTFQFRRLGVPEPMIGGRVDAWIDSLDIPGGSALIEKLRSAT